MLMSTVITTMMTMMSRFGCSFKEQLQKQLTIWNAMVTKYIIIMWSLMVLWWSFAQDSFGANGFTVSKRDLTMPPTGFTDSEDSVGVEELAHDSDHFSDEGNITVGVDDGTLPGVDDATLPPNENLLHDDDDDDDDDDEDDQHKSDNDSSSKDDNSHNDNSEEKDNALSLDDTDHNKETFNTMDFATGLVPTAHSFDTSMLEEEGENNEKEKEDCNGSLADNEESIASMDDDASTYFATWLRQNEDTESIATFNLQEIRPDLEAEALTATLDLMDIESEISDLPPLGHRRYETHSSDKNFPQDSPPPLISRHSAELDDSSDSSGEESDDSKYSSYFPDKESTGTPILEIHHHEEAEIIVISDSSDEEAPEEVRTWCNTCRSWSLDHCTATHKDNQPPLISDSKAADSNEDFDEDVPPLMIGRPDFDNSSANDSEASKYSVNLTERHKVIENTKWKKSKRMANESGMRKTHVRYTCPYCRVDEPRWPPRTIWIPFGAYERRWDQNTQGPWSISNDPRVVKGRKTWFHKDTAIIPRNEESNYKLTTIRRHFSDDHKDEETPLPCAMFHKRRAGGLIPGAIERTGRLVARNRRGQICGSRS